MRDSRCTRELEEDLVAGLLLDVLASEGNAWRKWQELKLLKYTYPTEVSSIMDLGL